MSTNQTRGKLVATLVMLSFIFGPRPSAGAAQAQPLVAGNTAFAFDLYRQLKASPGNLFFSPYSISTALAMTYAGARGDTEKQMASVLGFGKDPQAVSPAFGELQRQLNQAGQQPGMELKIANALWTQSGHPFVAAFLDLAKRDYQANLNQADFRTEAETARGRINHWVAQETKDKIQNILPEGSLTPATRLVLANAIYFKGLWAKPYDKAQTSTQTFHISANRLVGVPLMHHFDAVGYMQNADFQAVELSYKAGELSMVILLPRQIDACGSLENQLTPSLLASTLSLMRHQSVEIFLPRFKLESSFDLGGTLAGMGMPDAFGPKADFSGIDGTRQLLISGVFHKAWGEVNEEGTEAAAATSIAVAAAAVRQAPPPPPVFRADHPFIFLIRDTRSGSLLFLGRLTDPTH